MALNSPWGHKPVLKKNRFLTPGSSVQLPSAAYRLAPAKTRLVAAISTFYWRVRFRLRYTASTNISVVQGPVVAPKRVS